MVPGDVRRTIGRIVVDDDHRRVCGSVGVDGVKTCGEVLFGTIGNDNVVDARGSRGTLVRQFCGLSFLLRRIRLSSSRQMISGGRSHGTPPGRRAIGLTMTDNCPVRILQFASMQQPEVMARLIRLTRRSQATVILDLEDGHWDPTDEMQTEALKAAGRANLVALARTHPALFARHPIGVRINRISGPDVALDFDALAEASRFVAFECVVPTKVETGAELHDIVGNLRGRGVAFKTIVPIVETRRGLANVDEILDVAQRIDIEWLAYGHFDFALDSGWWPFPEPHEVRYWEHVEPLIRRWESAGLGWVHPPYFQTRDRAGMAGIIGRLQRTCTREFGIITVWMLVLVAGIGSGIWWWRGALMQ